MFVITTFIVQHCAKGYSVNNRKDGWQAHFLSIILMTMKRTHLINGAGFPLDLENLEKWEYTWKTWKYHGILKKLINIMEKWHETWKNSVATKNSPLTPLKQYKIH